MQPWLALCSLAAGASALLWLLPARLTAPLVWLAGDATTHPWTLWTSALVHQSGGHLLANLLSLGALAVLGRALRAGRAATLAAVLAWPLGTLALAVWPQVTAYRGLSGLIHALAGVLCAHAAINSIAKPAAIVLGCGLGLKLLTEAAWLYPVGFDPAWGFNVVVAAHLSGTLAGLVLGSAAAAVAQACALRMRCTRAVVE